MGASASKKTLGGYQHHPLIKIPLPPRAEASAQKSRTVLMFGKNINNRIF